MPAADKAVVPAVGVVAGLAQAVPAAADKVLAVLAAVGMVQAVPAAADKVLAGSAAGTVLVDLVLAGSAAGTVLSAAHYCDLAGS